MSNERPDEFLAWRGRIGQPDALPEQGLDDLEATWERLNVRLGVTRPGESGYSGGVVPDRKAIAGKRRRRVYRYGIAAVFLLLALIPANRFYKSRQAGNGTVTGRTQAVNGIVTGRTPSANGTATGRIADDPASTANRTTKGSMPAVIPELADGESGAIRMVSNPIGAGASKEKIPVARRRGQKTGLVALSAIADSRGRVEVDTLADSGVRLAVYVPPVKKMLRVVSINEIDNPTTTGPAITVHWPSIPIRVRLAPQGGDFSPVTADPTAPVLLKIKLNPQNP